MRYYVVFGLFCFALIAFTQQPSAPAVLAAPPAAPASAAQPSEAQVLVTREFGKTFTVDAKIPPMYADVDGDGQEDAIIIVGSETPMADEIEFKYRTIDPYDAYWGWGNAKDTVRFASTATGPVRFIAIIHNWRAPKAKFLVINLPFEKIGVGRAMLKKKPVVSVHTLETTGLESDLFWDGKKYRWEPGYMKQ